MLYKRWLLPWVLLPLLVNLTGCTVGPEYVRPETSVDRVEAFSWLPEDGDAKDDRGNVNDVNGIGSWWKGFADPATEQLVERALTHNTDIRMAVASVKRARALAEQAYGLRLPELVYSADASRQRLSFDFPGGRLNFMSNAFSQALNVAYVTDIFGALRRSERAAIWELMAGEADRTALRHTIVAQVVTTRIQIATQQRLLHIADATMENWQQTLDITQDRFEGGLTGRLDAYFAEQNLANARARRVVIEQQLGLLRHALNVLCGQPPASDHVTLAELESVPDLPPAPVGVPARLLDRRPDIQAAEMRLAAETERVGVGIARMYPDLTLTAVGGFNSSTFENVFDIQSRVYSIGLGITAPVFQAGRLRAGVRASRAAAEAAAQAYAGRILTAFREVEDALMSEQLIQQQIEHYEQAFHLAVEAETLARDRYQQGAETILTLLESQRNRSLAQNELALAQGQLWEARVRLYLALGGDWF